MPVIECDTADARDRLREAGVEITPGNTDHEQWRASDGDATAVAYEGKVVVQEIGRASCRERVYCEV